MLTLPLPAIVSLVLAYTSVRVLLGEGRGRWHPLAILLVAAIAAQSLLVALVHYYGFTDLRWVQPITAAGIPALTWCTFVAIQIRQLRKQDTWHVSAPAITLVAVIFWPQGLDLLVIGSFLTYGIALLFKLGLGNYELPMSRLASDTVPLWLWRIVAICLLGSGIGDGIIAWDQFARSGQAKSLLISGMSSLMLLAIGSVGLSNEWLSSISPRKTLLPTPRQCKEPVHQINHQSQPSKHTEVQNDLVARLDMYMADKKPWLNPDLTLLSLARKLGVPAKVLSSALNVQRGLNVARYVNQFRIDYACTLLKGGNPVTHVIYECGFNTKSNFHREFLRITKLTPTQWLKQIENPCSMEEKEVQ